MKRSEKAKAGPQFRECEDCGEEVPGRRLRCRDCNKLVCNWCAGHVHDTRRESGQRQRKGKRDA